MKSETILAIETAIAGGSLAVSASGDILYRAANGVSRAEELIDGIDIALRSSGKTPSDLSKIVVSVGPGSFTGIRIGIATAIGLARSLSIFATGISLFEAIAATSTYKNTLVAIAIGANRYGIQRFYVDKFQPQVASGPISISDSEYSNLIDENPNSMFLHFRDGVSTSENEIGTPANVRYVNENLAGLLIRRAEHLQSPGDLAPIYLGR